MTSQEPRQPEERTYSISAIQQTLATANPVQTTERGGVYEKPNSWHEVVVNDDERPSEYRIFDVDLKPPQDER